MDDTVICAQCGLYDPVADRCRSLTTEAQTYRDTGNYCEEFVPGRPDGSDLEALFERGEE